MLMRKKKKKFLRQQSLAEKSSHELLKTNFIHLI